MGAPAAKAASRVEEHRDFLLKVARLRLGGDDLAQDVVQETLEAALRGRAGFAGRASLRTWLVGILKHKLSDALRARRPSSLPPSTVSREARLEDVAHLFDREGEWRASPAAWSDPSRALTDRHFFVVLERCLERLPPLTARAFVMREVFDMTTREICRELAVNSNHLGVLLYRARMSLRRCLEVHWFGERR